MSTLLDMIKEMTYGITETNEFLAREDVQGYIQEIIEESTSKETFNNQSS